MYYNRRNLYLYDFIIPIILNYSEEKQNKMKKQRFLSILSTLLITAGLLLLLSPRLASWWIDYHSNQNAKATEEMSAQALQDNLKSESDFDFDAIEEISPTGVLSNGGAVDEHLIVGRLLIPSIDLNLTVYNGVNNQILNAGLGTMRPDLTMGEGNFPIAGHYASTKNVLFADLTSVAIDDAIFLTDNEKTYEYRVYDTKIVDPSEIKWIYDEVSEERGKPIISLMNCYYVNGKNSGDRYFVFGELVDAQNNH